MMGHSKQRVIRWLKMELRTLYKMSIKEISVSKNEVSSDMLEELRFFAEHINRRIIQSL